MNFFRRRWGQIRWPAFALPVQLYVIVCLAVILLPDGIRFPYQPSALALLTERLTSVSAALLCCLLGALRPRRWHLLASSVIAAVSSRFCTRTSPRSIAWRRRSSNSCAPCRAIRASSPPSNHPSLTRASWCNTSPIVPASATASAMAITNPRPRNSVSVKPRQPLRNVQLRFRNKHGRRLLRSSTRRSTRLSGVSM